MGEEHKVHVGSLSYNTDDDSLKYFFEDKVVVEVVDAKVILDRDTGRSRGFGFVTLGSASDVDKALNYDGELDLDGRTIKIQKAKSREGGGGGGGGRRGGGFRGGRGGGGGGGRYSGGDRGYNDRGYGDRGYSGGGGGGHSGGGYSGGGYSGGSGGSYNRGYGGGGGRDW